jgi:RNA polymerase sigma-70 factor (ECF subfamily)
MTTDKPKLVAAMFCAYSGRLRQYFRRRRAHVTELGDLAQEVFLRMLRTPDDEEILNPEAYLFTIARNLAREVEQKRSQLPLHVDINDSLAEQSLRSNEDPVASAAARQRFEDLERTLARQPASVAMAFILHRYEGRKVSEIAQELGVAQITVKKYLARVSRQLRDDGQTRTAESPWS